MVREVVKRTEIDTDGTVVNLVGAHDEYVKGGVSKKEG